nr:hypothetical protein [Tanacetum cinerariifolium]
MLLFCIIKSRIPIEQIVKVADEVSATFTTTITTDDELTLAQTFIEIKAAKPKAITNVTTTATAVSIRPKEKGIIMQEPSKTPSPKPIPIPPAPAVDFKANVLAEWNALHDVHNEVACLMLGSMSTELHRQFENYSPYEMLHELRSMFKKQPRVERFVLIQTFHAFKQKEGKSVVAYVLQMKGYVDQLERLGYMLPQDIIVGLILNGLTKDFAGFMRIYNMHNIGKTIGELHAMLIEYEKGLPKKAETPQVMMIKCGKIQKAKKKSLKAKGKGKANGKGNDKQVYISKPKNPKPYAKKHPAKDDACHHCKEMGHWKRNCVVYLAGLLKKKKQVGSASSSGIFTIELFAFPNKSWVYDTVVVLTFVLPNRGLEKQEN